MPPRVPYTAADLLVASPGDGEPVRFWANGDDAAYARWGRLLVDQRRASGSALPRTLLSISGGSDKGAYSAGLLNAWSRRGDRPSFDIVTGVSTGALIAPFAFLGVDQDAALRAIYTNIGRKDVYRMRILGGLLGGASILDTKPLASLIGRYITPAFLDRVAAEHRRGRRLLVMTTNLDAQRGVIWDMGAIAAGSAPDRLTLFRRVLLASASIPGAFPPILIDSAADGRRIEEMHVDGGAIGGFFVLPRPMLTGGAAGSSGGTIYVLYNGRLDPQFSVVEPRTFSIVSRALSTVLGEIDRTGIDALARYSRDTGGRLAVCSIDRGTPRDDAPLFDTAHMRELYALGEQEVASSSDCLTRQVDRRAP